MSIMAKIHPIRSKSNRNLSNCLLHQDPLVKGGRIAFKAIRGDSCRQYEFAENLAE